MFFGHHGAVISVVVTVLIPAWAVAADPSIPQPAYDTYFTDAALRVDLIHTGTRGKELFGLDELVVENTWPGPRRHLLDPTGYGKYRFRVLDQATGKEIFSQGYCTLFGEWLATEEAAEGVYRSMTEPLRFPFPRAPIVLIVEVRGEKTNKFKEIQRFEIDTQAYDLRREQTCDFQVETLVDSGRSSAQTVDVVIIPDGYTRGEERKMVLDAKRFTRVLQDQEPFSKHVDKISVRLVKAFSRESGPDEPRKGIFRDTIVDTTFDTFRSPRYLTTSNMKALREVASLASYDTIFVMVNTNRYGGGGIYGAYSIFTSDSEYDEYVMIHEFGHGFGGLADEYYSTSTGYDEDAFFVDGVEPWEPNITAHTSRDKLKWKHLLSKGVPIPTPDTAENDGVVGLFEGAGYKAKGLFRATRDSKMFHKGMLPFGPVNDLALELMIRYYTDAEVER